MKLKWKAFTSPYGNGLRVFRDKDKEAIGTMLIFGASTFEVAVWHNGRLWRTTCDTDAEARSVMAEMICALYTKGEPVQYEKPTYIVANEVL